MGMSRKTGQREMVASGNFSMYVGVTVLIVDEEDQRGRISEIQ
jgi:hypothetical protein